METHLEIGPSPTLEECVQVGTEGYASKAREECQRFIALIRRVLGPEKGSARLAIKSTLHELGAYQEVVCYFDPTDAVGVEYAFNVESNAPQYWVPPEGPKATLEYMAVHLRIDGEHVNLWMQNNSEYTSHEALAEDVLTTIIEALVVKLEINRRVLIERLSPS